MLRLLFTCFTKCIFFTLISCGEKGVFFLQVTVYIYVANIWIVSYIIEDCVCFMYCIFYNVLVRNVIMNKNAVLVSFTTNCDNFIEVYTQVDSNRIAVLDQLKIQSIYFHDFSVFEIVRHYLLVLMMFTWFLKCFHKCVTNGCNHKIQLIWEIGDALSAWGKQQQRFYWICSTMEMKGALF